MISIIIPAHREPFLQKTIDSILKSARGEIEVLPVLDGWIPQEPIHRDKRVKVITLTTQLGMRAAINAGISQSKGEFVMKCDAHCAFGEGFDIILSQNCREDWLVVPRRFSLDEASWQPDKGIRYRDYHFLTYPTLNPDGIVMSSVDWKERTRERKDPKYDIDDTMIFQGSCWMAYRKHFLELVRSLDPYGGFFEEPLELCLKYWLFGSKVKVIKKTWYAHLLKKRRHYEAGIFTRSYKRNQAHLRTLAAKHWMENAEPGMNHPLSWLIEKFWPVPTWPEDRSKWIFPFSDEDLERLSLKQ